MKKPHPGFKAVAAKVAARLQSKGVSAKAAKERAGAIVAAGARKASAKAVRANPKLKKVKGKMMS